MGHGDRRGLQPLEPLERCHETAAVALNAKVILVPPYVLQLSVILYTEHTDWRQNDSNVYA